jgi:hypothetical protein
MATYKEQVGTAVQNIAGDTGTVAGQLWYDSSNSEFKYRYQAYGSAWVTANSLNTARNNIAGATSGTQTASLAFGGFVPPHTGATESYNGTNWTELNDLNTARNNTGGAGTQTSALAFGGGSPDYDLTELWNGTNWTEVNDLNTARNGLGGTGADNTAALAFGGESPGTANHADTELWNGTNWTEVNNLNTGRDGIASGVGVTTAALAFGGNSDPSPLTELAVTENWNGTNWTDVADLITARKGLAGAGSNTAALAMGGRTPSVVGTTETWNGSIWSTTATMNLVQSLNSGAGTNTAAITFGGYDGSSPGNVATTQEFNAGVNLAAWFTNNNMNDDFGLRAGAGATTSAIVGGGAQGTSPFAAVTNSESWNGTNWSQVNNINTARSSACAAGANGTAALIFTGNTRDAPSPPANPSGKTELWNGYTWTEVNDLSSGRRNAGGFGTQTAALSFAGYTDNPPTPVRVNTESWNGTNWTEVNDMNLGRAQVGVGGSNVNNTAGLAISGNAPSVPGFTAAVESWNGTNWTEVNDVNQKRVNTGASGTSSAALFFGGEPGPVFTVGLTEEWNGTNWSETGDMNQARQQLSGQGSATAALATGGNSNTPNLFSETFDGTGFITKTITTTTD